MRQLAGILLAGLVVPLVLASEHLGRSLEQWQADLGSADEVVRLLAARSIGEMALAGTPGAGEALLAALAHADGSVRYWAATAAARMKGDDEARTRALGAALEDPMPEVQVQAAFGLVREDHQHPALGRLEALLSHANRGVRLHAVHAADALGNASAPLADALRKAVGDDFDYVQRVARHALWTLGERSCPYRDCDGEEAP